MAETKDRQIMVNIEPTFYEIAQRVIGKEGLSWSAYGRNLIIADLTKRGLLTESILTQVLTGGSA